MSRARDLSKLGNINTFAVDSTDTQVGIASTVPNATLDVGGDGVFTGIVTATSFSGSGANLTGIANTATVVSTATTTGLLNVTGTTDSTSSTTGSVTIAGGVGIAKNVYIGAGLSIAGTLTYEDVTNVDSVGLITAKSGVNISGGELKVGSAVTVSGVGVVTFIGAAGVAVTITPSTGKVQATTFEGPLTGNVTGDVTGDLTGTVNTAAQTSITSVGTLAGLTVGSAGEFKVGTALTVASTSGVATFSNDVTFKDAGYQGIKFENSGVKFSDQDVFFVGDNQTIKWVHDANCIRWEDSAQAQFGTGQDLRVYHDGSHSYFNETTGQIKLRLGGNDRIVINNSGTVTTGITTANGAAFDCTVGPLKEKVKITAGKLSDNTAIDLYDGMVHYFTTQETTTSTPTIRYRNSTNTALNHVMSIGDVVTVTVITTAAAAGYSANWAIDGNNVTEEWVGGSAPTAGGSDGLDIYSLTIIKTADATFTVVANLSNASN